MKLFKNWAILAFAVTITIALVGCAGGGNSQPEDKLYDSYEESPSSYDFDGLGGGYDREISGEKAKETAPTSIESDSTVDKLDEITEDIVFDEATEEMPEPVPAIKSPTTTKLDDSARRTERLMIIKTADLSFEVKKVDEASNDVLAIAAKYNAIIVDSHKYQDDDGHSFATTTIRVSPQYFEKLTADLKSIEGGELTNEQISGTDITKEYVDLKARLRNKTEVQARYIDLMDKGGTVPDILAVERELERVGEEIERLEGEIRYFENQVSLSTVTVNLSEPSVAMPGERSFSDAIKDAFRLMIAIIIFLIQALIVLMPFIVLIVIIALIIKVILKLKKGKKEIQPKT